MSDEVNRLLNVSQAAHTLNVSVSYLNKLRLTHAGPPFVKLGARVAYDPGDLATWIADHKVRSTSGEERAARNGA